MQGLGVAKPTIFDYWKGVAITASASRKGLRTAIILITWEIWKERNARVFNNIFATPSVVFQRIKIESTNWILAGAKSLAILRE